jgi:5-formyltetrahydrofolate cyclo-ligase
VDDQKRVLRSRIRADRRRRTAEERRENAERLAARVLALPELAHARQIAAYASAPTEPGTDPLRTALRARGLPVLLPVPRPDHTLDWAQDDGHDLPHSGVGGRLPAGDRLGPDALARADAIIVPALAVDSLGTRLGQGGGYYDRALAGLDPRVPIIALVHTEEFLDASTTPLPREDHDHRVGIVITPSDTHRLPHDPGLAPARIANTEPPEDQRAGSSPPRTHPTQQGSSDRSEAGHR